MLIYKIFNPKTSRYINTTSKNGIDMINNYKLKYNKEISNPLSQDYINISDKGLVSKYKMNGKLYELQNLLGEFSDLYSVANNSKTLCAFDFTSYGKKKYNSHKHLKLINEVINP